MNIDTTKSYKQTSFTSSNKLAYHGGSKVRKTKFPEHNIFGEEEEVAVQRVLKSKVLSQYLGAWHEDFYGGKEVRAFEKEWAKFFGVKHAIAVNSATSGIYAAIGAIGINPEDEVIVTPYSMSCSAVAPLVYNAVPVFADIEEDYFCLSAKSIEERISNKTKAILVVDLFGQPYDVAAINTLAKKYGLYVIEDAAQAPLAKYDSKFAGTLGDIGIYSLNYHKHIHTGEGGVVVTDNDDLAEKIQLIRNHAEAVLDNKQVNYTANMIGFNYRMTEIQAAIGRVQLSKLNNLLNERRRNVSYLEQRLANIPCLTMSKVRDKSSHSYYLHVIKFDEQIAGVKRDLFVDAVKAELMPTELRETEGVRVISGYCMPLYLQKIYQKKNVYGTSHYPWSNSNVSYQKGICPTVERMNEYEIITHDLIKPGMKQQDLDDVADAFEKVWMLRGVL